MDSKFQTALENAIRCAPNRTLAIRRLSAATEHAADYGLHLDVDPVQFRTQLGGHVVQNVEDFVASLGFPEDRLHGLDYTDAGVAAGLINRLLDPDLGVAGTLAEIDEIESAATNG